MKNHKHYDLCYRAHYHTSFTPDKRAEQYCASFDDAIAELESLNIEQRYIDKYERLWIDWMNAKSRCMSSMITGPANFPVARNEKANVRERSAGDECCNYYKKLVDYAKREAYYEANPEARPIASNDDDALERLQARLATQQAEHDAMKAANKAQRGTHAPYELTNSNARIKATKDRIAQLEKRKEQGKQEIVVNGVRVLQNPEAMRLQLFFDGKPAPDMIALLKSKAFKWSPRNGCWQRQLTNNALFTFKHYIKPALEA